MPGKQENASEAGDLVVKSDGSIWFTDPHYGIISDYQGHRAVEELPCNVYRVDPDGAIEAVVTDFSCPYGLAFSPDESKLYIADTGRAGSGDAQPRTLLRDAPAQMFDREDLALARCT